jgi:hypothetical protein
MVGAIGAVHIRNGLWNASGGIELPLVYALAATALGFTGPGAFSLDRLHRVVQRSDFCPGRSLNRRQPAAPALRTSRYSSSRS